MYSTAQKKVDSLDLRLEMWFTHLKAWMIRVSWRENQVSRHENQVSSFNKLSLAFLNLHHSKGFQENNFFFSRKITKPFAHNYGKNQLDSFKNWASSLEDRDASQWVTVNLLLSDTAHCIILVLAELLKPYVMMWIPAMLTIVHFDKRCLWILKVVT